MKKATYIIGGLLGLGLLVYVTLEIQADHAQHREMMIEYAGMCGHIISIGDACHADVARIERQCLMDLADHTAEWELNDVKNAYAKAMTEVTEHYILFGNVGQDCAEVQTAIDDYNNNRPIKKVLDGRTNI
ncbi:MAG TPA: hypothetical protein VK147_02975 [Candidatus Didemnitutus sp.]|nr:hypothetical protein [Candidatus Didemnitutus sp.]